VLKDLTDVDVRYSLVTPNGLDALHAAIPAAHIRSVNSAAPKAVAPGSVEPAAATDDAISAWVKALGAKLNPPMVIS